MGPVFTRKHIIAEIKRTAEGNRGAPLGIARFEAETGIKTSDWMGKFWVRWGEALTEAGFRPNELQGARTDDDLLEHLATFTRQLGRVPVANEMKLKARSEPGFPWHSAFGRFGKKRALVTRLRDFALTRGYEDVARLCDVGSSSDADTDLQDDSDSTAITASVIGFVYLLRSGRYHKIGRSNAVGRRERELAIQLPEKADVVHSIKTDDPPGIEAYWHNRFAERRMNGEWFELTSDDVKAFKRRKFM